MPLTKKCFKYSARIVSLKEKMADASKITVNADKNNGQENQPFVLEEFETPVLIEKSSVWLINSPYQVKYR